MISAEALKSWLPVALCALLGAWLGGGVQRDLSADLQTPTPLDEAFWNQVQPQVGALARRGARGGAHLAGGALRLPAYALGASDRLTHRLAGVHTVELELAPESGALEVSFRSPQGRAFLSLEPEGYTWMGDAHQVTAHEGPYVFHLKGQELSLEGSDRRESLAVRALELSAGAGGAALRRVRLSGAGGDTVLDYSDQGVSAPWGWILGALWGLGLACSGRAVLRRGGLPLAAPLWGGLGWLGIRLLQGRSQELWESLYLLQWEPWEAARIAVALALSPALALGLLSLEALKLKGRPRPAWILQVSCLLICAALASREGISEPLALGTGLLLLGASLALVRAAVLPGRSWLIRSSPGWLVLAAGGWSLGGALAWLWQLLMLPGALPLLRHHPRAAASYLSLLLLGLPVALELGVRGTQLGESWDAERLQAGAEQGSEDPLDAGTNWRNPQAFWGARCGSEPRETLLFVGGSSTGGAYQFQNEPEVFFAGQAHAMLCEAGYGVETWNYGLGGRDTFTISRTLELMLERHDPSLVILYVGVNDILTTSNSKTRREREEEEQVLPEAVSYGHESRLITGMSLALRALLQQLEEEPEEQPAEDSWTRRVSEVPLPDARENLERIAALLEDQGRAGLMVTQYIHPDQAPDLYSYWEMEAELSAREPVMRLLDARVAMEPLASEGLLIDRNHLSRQGNFRLAQILLPELERLFPAGARQDGGASDMSDDMR